MADKLLQIAQIRIEFYTLLNQVILGYANRNIRVRVCEIIFQTFSVINLPTIDSFEVKPFPIFFLPICHIFSTNRLNLNIIYFK